METETDFIVLVSKIIADGDCSHEIKRRLLLGRKFMTNLDSIWKSRHYCQQSPCSQSSGISSSHVHMWHLDHKADWAPKKMLSNCGAGEDSWETLGLKEIKPVNPKGNQPWILLGRAYAELKLQYFSHLTGRDNSLEKNLDAGKDWRQKEKRVAEDEIVRQHHWLNSHGFEQTLGDSEGQRSLWCCNSWSYKESDMT